MRAHGATTVTAFRVRPRGSSVGLSLSTLAPDYLEPGRYETYRISASDVMLHWAQPALPLGGRAFGHEQEIILKPFASVEPNPTGGDFYHISYVKNLPSIAGSGLRPGAGSAMGIGGYASHSRGKLFLTDREGVAYWYNRAELFAQHNSDDPYGDGLTPVVLRISGVTGQVPDELGSRDAMYPAWSTNKRIAPSRIKVWDGEAWQSLSAGVKSLRENAAMAYDEDSDGDEIYLILKPEHSNPLLSPFVRLT